jgi:hypothetical protein
MEAAMYKFLATIVGAIAILSGSMLASDRAEAGASASAPSKYSRSSQVAAYQVNRHGRVAITEYSSSSARNASQKH